MKNNYKRHIAVGQAILAAALFGMSAPFSKLILKEIPPLLLSSLLYLGAGIGMLSIDIVRRVADVERHEARLQKQEMTYVVLMVLLDIAAPILLMLGLTKTTSATASLLSNFEIVTTSIIALVVFKEAVGKRLWISITLITLSSILLSVEDFGSFSFSLGSVLVLLACLSWGLENNCTRKLSLKDPLQVVIIKGFGSGIGSLIIAILAKEVLWNTRYILLALLLGFFAYGLSIFFYVTAQRELGAARTSTYYAVAPFIGVGISFIAFSEPITSSFALAAIVMVIGTYFAVVEKHSHNHVHKPMEHEHRHNHSDGHHNHTHPFVVIGEHSHPHEHEELVHAHEHTPDIHHSHEHFPHSQ
ncbi:putative membrane protein [Clostridiales bacterium oral taxon 876 str. F0540]|nr:putative membrane protein [Clostridiales bacterium oral taxon 876 str. F0540]